MRVVVVFSQANYVPDNYLEALTRLTDPAARPDGVEIVGLVLVRTVSVALAFKMLFLWLAGVRRLAATLLRNMAAALLSDPRRRLMAERGIPVLLFTSVNAPEAVEAIAALRPDLILNMRTRDIYRKKILAVPAIGCVNVHHGLLPERRGTMCDLWAWVEGRPVGFSVHWMNRKIDDGEIILTQEVDVAGVESYVEIPLRSSRIEAEKLLEVLARIAAEGKWFSRENRSDAVTHTRNPSLSQIREMRRKGYRL